MEIETKIDQILKIVKMNQQDMAELKSDIAELKKDVKELKQEVAELKDRVTKLEVEVEKLKAEVEMLKAEVEKLKIEVEKIKVRVSSLERSVALIEFEHGEKISALFDNIKVNKDEHKKLENLSLSIKSEIQGTLFDHEKRISKLEGDLVPNF